MLTAILGWHAGIVKRSKHADNGWLGRVDMVKLVLVRQRLGPCAFNLNRPRPQSSMDQQTTGAMKRRVPLALPV